MNAKDFRVALLVITDGRRDCIQQTIPSAEVNLYGVIATRTIYDDSGDPDHAQWLRLRFPTYRVVTHPEGRQGFGGAIRAAWSHLGDGPGFVFHLEDDFTFHRMVYLSNMARVLLERPYLVQLCLRRQPWNEHERLAGGIVEQHPDAYEDMADDRGNEWLEHRLFFSTNPSLYRRSLCATEWPTGGESEGHFSHQIIQSNHDARFAFWGSRDSGEWVHHIGHERVGVGY